MLLWDEDQVLEWHHKLANHFLKSKQDDYHTSDTILKHLVQAKMKIEMQKFFRQDARSLRIGHTKKSLAIKVTRIISINSVYCKQCFNKCVNTYMRIEEFV